MSTTTKIEWCDHTWSPWRGCTKVSPGCANCYAERLSKRNPAVLGKWGKGKPRVLAKDWEKPVRWNRDFAEAIQLADRCFPYRDRSQDTAHRPRVFPSMCDWLDPEVDPQWLFDFLKLVLRRTPEVRWLLLTKWPELFRERLKAARDRCTVDPMDVTDLIDAWLAGDRIPLNVGIGTSIEDQPRGDERIPELLKIPARFRFLSVEPMLGPVDLGLNPSVRCPHCGEYVGGHATGGHDICDCRIDWVIVGGESGPGARPCNVERIRDVVKQCAAAKVPCFVKQLGTRPVLPYLTEVPFGDEKNWPEGTRFGCHPGHFKTEYHGRGVRLRDPKGGDMAEWPEELRVRQFPKAVTA